MAEVLEEWQHFASKCLETVLDLAPNVNFTITSSSTFSSAASPSGKMLREESCSVYTEPSMLGLCISTVNSNKS